MQSRALRRAGGAEREGGEPFLSLCLSVCHALCRTGNASSSSPACPCSRSRSLLPHQAGQNLTRTNEPTNTQTTKLDARTIANLKQAGWKARSNFAQRFHEGMQKHTERLHACACPLCFFWWDPCFFLPLSNSHIFGPPSTQPLKQRRTEAVTNPPTVERGGCTDFAAEVAFVVEFDAMEQALVRA